MFKKFNWGHGILVFYICFVAAVVTALIASFSLDHSLLVDDYYSKDLAYQKQYDKVKNNNESQRVNINNDKSAQSLTIDFIQADEVKGYVDFYRPSDKSEDFKVELKDKETIIATDKLLPGKWILKIDWTEKGKPYYMEEIIFI